MIALRSDRPMADLNAGLFTENFNYIYNSIQHVDSAEKLLLDIKYPINVNIFNYIMYFHDNGYMLATFLYFENDLYYKPSTIYVVRNYTQLKNIYHFMDLP